MLLLASQSAFAFEQKIDTVIVSHDNCEILQLIITIDNTDREALWLWVDNRDYSNDDRKAIKSYLMKRKGDFSIYDIATDPNMVGEWWHPSAPKDSFVKYLIPGGTFTFVFYRVKAPKLNMWDSNSIINDIHIFWNHQIEEICPGIEEQYCVKRISYPYDIIVFPFGESMDWKNGKG